MLVAVAAVSQLSLSAFAARPSAGADVAANIPGGGSILHASPDKIRKAVRAAVTANPAGAADYVEVVLSSGRGDAATIAPSIVGTAIESLGDDPSDREVAAIVSAAVRSTPTAVLKIVSVAVAAAPASAAPEIVTAAVGAVPDPTERVAVGDATRDYKDFKGGKTVRDFKDDGRTMTLAEAIVQAAFEARAGLDLAELIAAASLGETSLAALLYAAQRGYSLTGYHPGDTSGEPNLPIVPGEEKPPTKPRPPNPRQPPSPSP